MGDFEGFIALGIGLGALYWEFFAPGWLGMLGSNLWFGMWPTSRFSRVWIAVGVVFMGAIVLMKDRYPGGSSQLAVVLLFQFAGLLPLWVVDMVRDLRSRKAQQKRAKVSK